MGEFWNIQGHWAVLKTILREGEKTKSPKISQGAFADRTVSSNLTQTHLKPPDVSTP